MTPAPVQKQNAAKALYCDFAELLAERAIVANLRAKRNDASAVVVRPRVLPHADSTRVSSPVDNSFLWTTSSKPHPHRR